MRRVFLSAGVCISVVAAWAVLCNADDLIQAPAAIHMSSTVSDGKLSIPEIIGIARAHGIHVVITADRDHMKWEYGVWPLRNVFKRTVEDKSIATFGIRRYVGLIESLQKSNPDMILIGGMESAPYYHWQGSLLKHSLQLRDWHKHLLVLGLDTPRDILRMPVIGNPQGLRTGFRPLLCWPVLLLVVGMLWMRKRRYRYKDSRGRPLGPYDRRFQAAGIVCSIVGLLFSFNNWPFFGMKFDQYGPDRGILPYQNLITYVKEHGGLTFWAHPEAKNVEWVGSIKTDTQAHVQDLIETANYTGFSVFYEGYNEVGLPGGVWDEVLSQYCRGVRSHPVWAIGALSFDSSGSLAEYMKDVRTVLLLRAFTNEEVLRSLRDGNMYALRGKNSARFLLDVFALRSGNGGVASLMGQEVSLHGAPTVEIKGHCTDGAGLPVKVRLIRDGKVIQTFSAQSPFSITYADTNAGKERKYYYRIEIEAEGLLCVSNPIFAVQNTM